jgi:hypothetical protein
LYFYVVIHSKPKNTNEILIARKRIYKHPCGKVALKKDITKILRGKPFSFPLSRFSPVEKQSQKKMLQKRAEEGNLQIFIDFFGRGNAFLGKSVTFSCHMKRFSFLFFVFKSLRK